MLDRELHLREAEQILATEHGPRLVLLREGTKLPAFKGWQEQLVELAELAWHFRHRVLNLGLKVGNGLMAADFESAEAREHAHFHLGLPPSPMVTVTARGFHE